MTQVPLWKKLWVESKPSLPEFPHEPLCLQSLKLLLMNSLMLWMQNTLQMIIYHNLYSQSRLRLNHYLLFHQNNRASTKLWKILQGKLLLVHFVCLCAFQYQNLKAKEKKKQIANMAEQGWMGHEFYSASKSSQLSKQLNHSMDEPTSSSRFQ